MSLGIEERLKHIQTEMENAKVKRIQAETRLESSAHRKAELEADCQAEGVHPDELDERIAAYETEIEEAVAKLEAALSKKDAPTAQQVAPDVDALPF